MLLAVEELEKELNTKEEMFRVLKEKIDVLNVLKNQKTYIDDHNNKERVIDAIVEFNSNYRELGIFHFNSNFCINKAYVGKDGKIHLSQCSIGPTINTRGSRPLEYIIDEYNNEQKNENFKISKLYFPDGTVEIFD